MVVGVVMEEAAAAAAVMVGVTPVPTEVVQVAPEAITPVHMSEPKTGEAYHGGRAVIQGGAHRIGRRYSREFGTELDDVGMAVAGGLWRWLKSALSAMCGRPELARLFSRVQHWSVRPCVRPMSAVHVTAGHNALRGSGPGQ